MKKHSLKVLFIYLLVIVASCGDYDNAISEPRVSLLTSKEWRQASVTLNNVEFTQPCDRDDVILFEEGGNYLLRYNTRCHPDDIELEEGSWALLQNDERLSISRPGIDPDVYDVVELSATTLKLATPLTINGTAFSAVLTFKAQ